MVSKIELEEIERAFHIIEVTGPIFGDIVEQIVKLREEMKVSNQHFINSLGNIQNKILDAIVDFK